MVSLMVCIKDPYTLGNACGMQLPLFIPHKLCTERLSVIMNDMCLNAPISPLYRILTMPTIVFAHTSIATTKALPTA